MSARRCCRSPAPCRRCRRRKPRFAPLLKVGSGSRRSLPDARRVREPLTRTVRTLTPGPPMLPGMSTLREPLTRALGPKTGQALENALGVPTVGDLLRHYPRRYYSRGELTDLSSLREGDHVTVLARVDQARLLTMPNRNFRSRGEVIITDDRAKLVLTFFFRNPRGEHGFGRRARHGGHVRGHRVQLPRPAPAGPPGVRAAARRAAQRGPHPRAGRGVRRRGDPGLCGYGQGQLVDHRQVDPDRPADARGRGRSAARAAARPVTGCTARPKPSGPSTGRSTGRTGTGPGCA